MAADPSLRTLFRRALQKALHEQLTDEGGDKMVVVGGLLDPPQDRDLACVWWEGKRPHSKAAILEENFYRVRLFRRFKQDQGGETPRVDQAELLEAAAEDLEAALKAILTLPWLATVSHELAVGDHDFFNVLEITTNYQGQYVEAAITAFATNRSGAGG